MNEYTHTCAHVTTSSSKQCPLTLVGWFTSMVASNLDSLFVTNWSISLQTSRWQYLTAMWTGVSPACEGEEVTWELEYTELHGCTGTDTKGIIYINRHKCLSKTFDVVGTREWWCGKSMRNSHYIICVFIKRKDLYFYYSWSHLLVLLQFYSWPWSRIDVSNSGLVRMFTISR